MSNAPDTSTDSTRTNPLLPLHQQMQAETQLYAETEIVLTFGEPQAEYAALHKSCALVDLPQRGLLQLTGKDRLPFLNNLLTNQTYDKDKKTGMAVGTGVYTFLLNLKGRIVADMNVLNISEDRTLVEMDRRMIGVVKPYLEKYLFVEKVIITDVSPMYHEIGLFGPTATNVLAELIGPQTGGRMSSSADLPRAENLANGDVRPPENQLQSTSAKVMDADITIYRDDITGPEGYVLILPMAAAKNIWLELYRKFAGALDLGKRPLRPTGWAAFNAARIENGRPIFGIDFDDSILPAETGQFDRAVNVNKGCYLGQEIVARMHARQQVAKQLVGIRMDGDALPVAGNKIFDDASNEIGGITSSTLSPVLSNVAICLGYLKKPHFNLGQVVTIPAEGQMRKGVVVETPFMGKLIASNL